MPMGAVYRSMTSSKQATFGGGCFWCVEAAFKEIDGVQSVTSGYAGGDVADPSYRAVCSGDTGHAEVVQLTYDPTMTSYETLLEVFFTVHDPTQVNRQGPDVGSQYRSIILYHDDEQHQQAAAYMDAIAADYTDALATELVPLETFYPAEEYHQDYFEKNPQDAYCQMHAQPKVETVRSRF